MHIMNAKKELHSAQGPANAHKVKALTGSAEAEKAVTELNHTKDFERRAMQEGMEWQC
jgi:hypothetical protein